MCYRSENFWRRRLTGRLHSSCWAKAAASNLPPISHSLFTTSGPAQQRLTNAPWSTSRILATRVASSVGCKPSLTSCLRMASARTQAMMSRAREGAVLGRLRYENTSETSLNYSFLYVLVKFVVSCRWLATPSQHSVTQPVLPCLNLQDHPWLEFPCIKTCSLYSWFVQFDIMASPQNIVWRYIVKQLSDHFQNIV